MGASAEFCSPFTLNMTIDPSSMTMSDGCSGDISIAPDSNNLLTIDLVNANSNSIVYSQTYGSDIFGVGNNVNFYPSSAVSGDNYYLNISWNRIRYDDMGNPVLNGLFDKGEVQRTCPTTKTSSAFAFYLGSAGLSDCNYEGLFGEGATAQYNDFHTGNIQTFVNDGCTGGSALDDDFYDTNFGVGSRVPEGSSYQATFSCNNGLGSELESYWATGFYICQSSFGYDDVIAVDSCSNGASAPSGVCTYASGHNIRSNNFPIVYNSDSEAIIDFSSVGLDFAGSISWVSLTSQCFTDGLYDFVPEEQVVLVPSEVEGELPSIKLNISITNNVTLQNNPVSVSPVNVVVDWFANGVPTTCGGGCPQQIIQVSDTSYQVIDTIAGEFLEPDTTYSAELEYQQDGGEATYSETSDSDAFVDESDLSNCGDSVCNPTFESAFSCASDCFSGSGASSNNEGGSYIEGGVVGTGLENLYTGRILTINGAIASGVPSYSSWSFIFINRIGVGGSLI